LQPQRRYGGGNISIEFVAGVLQFVLQPVLQAVRFHIAPACLEVAAA
jgi:hypothetical protein